MLAGELGGSMRGTFTAPGCTAPGTVVVTNVAPRAMFGTTMLLSQDWQLVNPGPCLPAQVTDPLESGCAAAPADWPSAAADLRRALEQATALGYL